MTTPPHDPLRAFLAEHGRLDLLPDDEAKAPTDAHDGECPTLAVYRFQPIEQLADALGVSTLRLREIARGRRINSLHIEARPLNIHPAPPQHWRVEPGFNVFGGPINGFPFAEDDARFMRRCIIRAFDFFSFTRRLRNPVVLEADLARRCNAYTTPRSRKAIRATYEAVRQDMALAGELDVYQALRGGRRVFVASLTPRIAGSADSPDAPLSIPARFRHHAFNQP